jgi:two-component system LytT family sensor kinase
MMTRSIPLFTKAVSAYIMWVLLCGAGQARIITRFGFTWKEALTDALVTQLIISISYFVISKSLNLTIPSSKKTLHIISQCVAITILGSIAQEWLIQEIIKTKEYEQFLTQSHYIRFFINWLMVVMVALVTWSWSFFRDQQESINRKEDAERLAREAELANLRQQLQPHFLFNSLNSISALVGSQPERARNMIQQLSDFLRGTLKKDDKQLITLKEELTHLQLYLEIEKVRFGHRLATAIHASEGCQLLTLPSLLLQPIVENAIKFGLYDTLGDIEISLSARMENNYLLVEVKNPFDPNTAAPKKGTGFGLQSVNRRLFLVYGQPNLLKVEQEERIFITTLKIPQLA